MAKRIVLVDDIDGTDADETLEFGLGGTRYEIDLSSSNAEQMRAALAPFTSAARRVSVNRMPSKRTSVGPSAKQIRDWARTVGIEVSERGAIPREVRDAFTNR